MKGISQGTWAASKSQPSLLESHLLLFPVRLDKGVKANLTHSVI